MIVHLEGSAEEVNKLLSKLSNGFKKEQGRPEPRSLLSEGKREKISTDEEISNVPALKSDFLIPKFEWDRSAEKNYKTLFFFEHQDGRVMLSYMSAKTYTTKEKVMQLPYPVPNGLPVLKKVSVNNRTAIRLYREYLANLSAESLEDTKYKPMLRGAFSTRPGYEDFDKVEGDLE